MAEKEKKEKIVFSGGVIPLHTREVYIPDKLKEMYINFLKQKAQQTLTNIGINDEWDLKINEDFKKVKRQALENFFKLEDPGYTIVNFDDLYKFLSSIGLRDAFKKSGGIIKYLLPHYVNEELKITWDLPIYIKNIPEKFTKTTKEFLESDSDDVVVLKGFVDSITYINDIPVFFVVRHSLCGGTFLVENDIPHNKGLKNILKNKINACPLCGSSEGQFVVEKIIATDAYKLTISDIPKDEGKNVKFVEAYIFGKAMDLYSIPSARIGLVGITRRIFNGKEIESYLEVVGIEPLDKTVEEIELKDEDIKEIVNTVRGSGYNIIDMIAESMLPNIKGDQYKYIKRAVLLQAMSVSQQKEIDLLADRLHINILLLGDPGTGKSTLLRTVSKLIPKSRYAVATSLTKAGLLGTVTKSEEGKWVLEVGILPSASGGLLCVDEVNKLSPDDIKSLNEAMEHGTATIDKASVHVTLRANAAVLAASNPKYGRWDPNRELINQIDIEPTMLSRFDLIFVLRDIPNKEQDILEAKEILGKNKVDNSYFSKDFILKYIAYARSINPEISDEAETYIAKLYADLRDKTKDTFPITKRQLGTIERLAIAIAKARLSNVVTKEDVDYAWEIISNSIYSMVGNATQLDFGVVETGVKSSAKNRSKLVKEVIEQLNKTYGKGVTFNDIYNYLKDKYGLDISQTELKDLISLLKYSGDIYEPEPGLYNVL
ncbi:MAG: AAA family ATPase [Nanopusillaceae archaeon]|jgi:replicative DNA helicase Mcm